jgi:hypothetical protein
VGVITPLLLLLRNGNVTIRFLKWLPHVLLSLRVDPNTRKLSASPTSSMFQEVVNQPHQSGSDSHHTEPSQLSSDQHQANRGSPSLRYTAMSPPPRMSSSLAHVALPPPPRSSSLANQSTFRSQIPMFSGSTDSSWTGPTINSLEATTLQIVAPEPTTPPLPEENRGT